MTEKTSLLERAYQLALSGRHSNLALLVKQLAEEEYPVNEIRSLFKGDKFQQALERNGARGATSPPRPLCRVQPALRPRHDLRLAHRRQCRLNPFLTAASGEVAVIILVIPDAERSEAIRNPEHCIALICFWIPGSRLRRAPE